MKTIFKLHTVAKAFSIFTFTLTLSSFDQARAAAPTDDYFRTYGAVTVKSADFLHRDGGRSAENCASGSCDTDLITVGQLNDRAWGPYSNITDDATIAKKWLFLRNNRPTRYNCSIGLDFSVTNWITTTRCIDQIGSDKYEEIVRNALGVSGGQEYKQDVLDRQFNAEAPNIANIIRNSPRSKLENDPLVFEIGNEPNVFPAMSPQLYAAYYVRWVNEIRRVTAQVSAELGQTLYVKTMPGGLWIMEGQPAYLSNTLNQGAAFAFGRVTIRVPTGVGLCGSFPLKYPCVKFRNHDLLPGVDVKSRMYSDTAAYLRDFLAAVPNGYIDYGNLHFYPYIGPDSAYGEGQMQPHLDNLATLARTYAQRTNSGQVWLTEIGNFNPLNEDATIKQLMTPMLNAFKARSIPEVSRVYWFKSDGEDKKFSMLPKSANSIWFVSAVVLGNDLIQGFDLLLGPLFKVVRPVVDSGTASQLATHIKRFVTTEPRQGLTDDNDVGGAPRALGTVYYHYAMLPKPGDSADGSPDTWDGCRGYGLWVCQERVEGYGNYFRNYPTCLPNSTCDGQYYTCNAACPAPNELDR